MATFLDGKVRSTLARDAEDTVPRLIALPFLVHLLRWTNPGKSGQGGSESGRTCTSQASRANGSDTRVAQHTSPYGNQRVLIGAWVKPDTIRCREIHHWQPISCNVKGHRGARSQPR